MSGRPVVVVVGRPNVGKSTLFNRLTGSRRALVHDLPGVTRDRIVGDAERPGGGLVTLVDTGGLLMTDEDRFVPLIRSQAQAAVEAADLVLFLVDGAAGPLPEDREIADWIRQAGPPVVVVANKSDRRDVDLQAQEFFALGLGDPVPVSAEHGEGLDALWDAIETHLPEAAEEAGHAPRQGEISVAVIGRPNVGKSSLVNRLLGEARVLVSEVPGTTRDSVDVLLEKDGTRLRLVDTAGIRRKGRTDRGPEVLSVVMARRSLERADLCLVVVDCEEGITRQDAHVAGYAWEAGRAICLVCNKWDLVVDREAARAGLLHQVETQMKFVRHAPIAFLSALTGRGVQRLFPAVRQLAERYRVRMATTDLNQLMHDAWSRRPPPVTDRRAPKLYYAVQVHYGPPRFVLFTNMTRTPHFSYLRYLENVLRDALHLEGVPIQVMIRGRKR